MMDLVHEMYPVGLNDGGSGLSRYGGMRREARDGDQQNPVFVAAPRSAFPSAQPPDLPPLRRRCLLACPPGRRDAHGITLPLSAY
jgi:hypothetical protein